MKQRILVQDKCSNCQKVLMLRPLRGESRKRLDNRAFKAHSMGEHTADGLLRVVDVPEPGQPIFCAVCMALRQALHVVPDAQEVAA